MSLYLGLDTSAYTTSAALINADGDLVADERMVLRVEFGKVGLRQAEAHFQHTRNLPVLLERLSERVTESGLCAIGVSDRPRRLEESYMPVFQAGTGTARCLAAVSGLPMYRFSHQEGHVAAAHDPRIEDDEFLAVHFSGGTSEVLRVRRRKTAGYDIQILFESTDLNAGQLVDRVGVALGLPFPAGSQLEAIAVEQPTEETIPSVVTEKGFSFSGAETRAQHLIQKGLAPGLVAFLTFRCIANTLEKTIRSGTAETGLTRIVMAGGVMANTLIRNRLERRLGDAGLALIWAPVSLCSDNAVGAARLARMNHINMKRG